MRSNTTGILAEEMEKILRMLAYPEIYAKDYKEWFTGDGPAEAYFSGLSDYARQLFDNIELSSDKWTR